MLKTLNPMIILATLSRKTSMGNTEYTYSKDYFGNIVAKDKYGNTVGTYKRTILETGYFI
ncbi:MAG: hypothetical protein IPJ13_24525 [Saprospiraceae bacterium]|nr:hypothetical protein [Saprospiraceae bacterium]